MIKTKLEIELKLAFCEYLTNTKNNNKKPLFYFEFPIAMLILKVKKLNKKTINVRLNLMISVRLFDRVDSISRFQENIKKVSE